MNETADYLETLQVWLKSTDPFRRQECRHYIFQQVFTSCDLENEIKVTKIYSALELFPMTYLCKFGNIPVTGSRDIVGTRSGKPTESALKPICPPSPLVRRDKIITPSLPYSIFFVYSFLLKKHIKLHCSWC